jgi:hypothetical protein
VGYSAVGSRKSEEHLERAVHETRKRSTAVATAAVPGAAGYRFGRWAKREAGPTTTAPSLIVDDLRGDQPGREPAGAGGAGGAASVGSERRGRASHLAAKAAGAPRGSAPPLNLSPRAQPPASPSGGKVNGGSLFGPRSGAAGGSARPPAGGAPPREAAPAGGKSSPPTAPVGPSRGTGGRGSGGQGSSSPPRRQGGENGGRGWFGGGTNDRDGASSGGSGGGRSWLGGGSGGRTTPRRDADGPSAPPKGGSGRGSGARRDPASGAGGGANPAPEGGRQAPPLWSGKSREEAPAMPFWLRPVKRDDGEE